MLGIGAGYEDWVWLGRRKNKAGLGTGKGREGLSSSGEGGHGRNPAVGATYLCCKCAENRMKQWDTHLYWEEST
jgi:hypothetical protein